MRARFHSACTCNGLTSTPPAITHLGNGASGMFAISSALVTRCNRLSCADQGCRASGIPSDHDAFFCGDANQDVFVDSVPAA